MYCCATLFPVFLSVLLINTSSSEGAPTAKRAPITLPLKRARLAHDTTHPLIRHQQLSNRASKRAALLTNTEPPEPEYMVSSMDAALHAISAWDHLQRRADESEIHLPALLNMTLVEASGAGDHEAMDSDDFEKRQNGAPTPVASASQTNPGVNPIKANAAFSPNQIKPAVDPLLTQTLGLAIGGNDEHYQAVVRIGASDFSLIVDSGSSSTWIKKSTKTSAIAASGTPFPLAYLTGEAVPIQRSQDLLTAAGFDLPDFSFGLASDIGNFQHFDNIDGVMGLSPSFVTDSPTIIDELNRIHNIDAIVGYKLGHVTDATNDGEICFGGVDFDKHDLNSVVVLDNISPRDLWEVPLEGVRLNGQLLPMKGLPRRAIVDTGSTFVIAPMADAMLIHSQIAPSYYHVNGIFYVPCTTSAEVSLVLEGTSFVIPPTDLAHAPLAPGKDQFQGYCMSGIKGNVSPGIASNQWILGDVFLKNVYFWTDLGLNSVGFARLRL
ncbi:hypothetical protein ONZ45_g2983 [Pleurotus djamor]|nr:hypothetical protein ONZ45_g2983 [Pleurotus djamor]